MVVIVPTYGAGEAAPEGSDSLRLAVSVAEHHPHVRYVSSLPQLPQVLPSILQPGDLAIFLGAGDLNQQIAATMRAYAAQAGEQPLVDSEGELPGEAENSVGEMVSAEVLAS